MGKEESEFLSASMDGESLSVLRKSNAALRGVNKQRGAKIKELEARIADLHSELAGWERRFVEKSSELDALRKSFELSLQDAANLRRELRVERSKSIWQRIFGD
jgi:predicted nuclease with TOPRIM domain